MMAPDGTRRRLAMNGVHDMGGMHGFGAIERDEAMFHADWEKRARAMMSATVGRFYHLDAFRYGIEQMDPAHYLRSSYFERWLASVEYNLAQAGVVTSEEIDSRTELLRREPDTDLPAPGAASHSSPPPAQGQMASSEQFSARFAVGDCVVARNLHPAGHTRMPRYVRGKRGVIHLVHGPEIFPDTNAHGLGENPEVVYSVRFEARELWGDTAEPGTTLNIDLWESYLEPASD
jgi:nitrile hydratase